MFCLRSFPLSDLKNGELKVKISCPARPPRYLWFEGDPKFAFDQSSNKKSADPASEPSPPMPPQFSIGRVPPFPVQASDEGGCGYEIVDVRPAALACDRKEILKPNQKPASAFRKIPYRHGGRRKDKFSGAEKVICSGRQDKSRANCERKTTAGTRNIDRLSIYVSKSGFGPRADVNRIPRHVEPKYHAFQTPRVLELFQRNMVETKDNPICPGAIS